MPLESDIREILYWFVSDYSETAAAWRVQSQVDPACDFAVKIIMDSDLMIFAICINMESILQQI